MLPCGNRLRKKTEIDKVFKRGKSFKESFLILKKAKGEERGNRFCFVVSQKVSKKAVERNRIKRALRELAKSYLEPENSAWDCVFIVLPEANGKSFSEIKKVAEELFKRAGF